jgi:hypothetical protein
MRRRKGFRKLRARPEVNAERCSNNDRVHNLISLYGAKEALSMGERK